MGSGVAFQCGLSLLLGKVIARPICLVFEYLAFEGAQPLNGEIVCVTRLFEDALGLSEDLPT